MKVSARIFFFVVILAVSVPAHAEIVKMVDENGKVYFTNLVPGTSKSKQVKSKQIEKENAGQYEHPNRSLTDQETSALSDKQIKQIEQQIDECISNFSIAECKKKKLMIHMFSTAMKWYIIHDKQEAERALREKWLQ